MTRRPLVEAVIASNAVVRLLAPGCERIDVAGSVRRKNLDCKDVEIVAVPRFAPDLLGGQGDDLLNLAILAAVRAGSLAYRNPRTESSARVPAYDLAERRYYPLWLLCGKREPWAVDLFVVRPPAQWGAIFAIRTGPADYAKRLVTGCQAEGYRCVEGHLVDESVGETISTFDTPEEADFIKACGFPVLPPEFRR